MSIALGFLHLPSSSYTIARKNSENSKCRVELARALPRCILCSLKAKTSRFALKTESKKSIDYTIIHTSISFLNKDDED